MNEKLQSDVAELRRTVDDLTARVGRLRQRRHMSERLFDQGDMSRTIGSGLHRTRHAVEDHPGVAALGVAVLAGAAIALALSASQVSLWRS